MTKVVVITDQVAHVDAVVDAQRNTFLVEPADLVAAVGWELKPSGLCRADTCVPVRDMAALSVDGRLDLVAVAAAVRQPSVVDLDGNMMAVALPAELRRQALADLVAPPFTLPDLDGGLHSLADWRGKKVLLVTFSSWCGCRYDLPGWQALQDELGTERFVVVAVAIDHDPEEVRRFAKGLTIPVLYDPQHVLTELYAISNVPTVVWIDETQRIVRPNAEAFGTDTFSDFTGAVSGPHLDLVRNWVNRGEVPIEPEAAAGAIADLSDDEVLARLHFRLATEASRQGDDERTRRHVEVASRLAPDDFTVWRAGMPLVGENPFGDAFLARYDEWKAKGSPAHSLGSVAE